MTPEQREITQTLYAGGVIHFTDNGPVLAYYSETTELSSEVFDALLEAELIELLLNEIDVYVLGPAWLLEVL